MKKDDKFWFKSLLIVCLGILPSLSLADLYGLNGLSRHKYSRQWYFMNIYPYQIDQPAFCNPLGIKVAFIGLNLPWINSNNSASIISTISAAKGFYFYGAYYVGISIRTQADARGVNQTEIVNTISRKFELDYSNRLYVGLNVGLRYIWSGNHTQNVALPKPYPMQPFAIQGNVFEPQTKPYLGVGIAYQGDHVSIGFSVNEILRPTFSYFDGSNWTRTQTPVRYLAHASLGFAFHRVLGAERILFVPTVVYQYQSRHEIEYNLKLVVDGLKRSWAFIGGPCGTNQGMGFLLGIQRTDARHSYHPEYTIEYAFQAPFQPAGTSGRGAHTLNLNWYF